MFKRFFAALAALTSNVEALAASFAEANDRFKRNLLGEDNDDMPAPEYSEREEPARIGRKKSAAK